MDMIYRLLAEIEQSGKDAALCTIVRTSGSTPRHEGSKMIVYPDGSFVGTVGGGEIESRILQEALEVIKDFKGRLVKYSMTDPAKGDPGICGGQVDVFIEPVAPRPTVLVIGGGHVGKTVVRLAKWLGFYVVVSDDRAEFATSEAHPDADEFLPVPMSEIPEHFTINRDTWIVLATRGVVVDVPGLPALVESPAPYIGVIGSKRRWTLSKQGLLEAGLAPEKLEKVHSPIGLELQAETPEEIALSIMAEIVKLRKGGSGESMRMK